MNENYFNLLMKMKSDIEKKQEIPFKILNKETDLLVEHAAKNVDLNNYLSFDIMKIEIDKGFNKTYIIGIDESESHTLGDYCFLLYEEHFYCGKVVERRKYFNGQCPYSPNSIVFAINGKTISPIYKRDSDLSYMNVLVNLNPYYFNMEGYKTIGSYAFSCYDPFKHNVDSFNLEPKKRDIVYKKNRLTIPGNIIIVGSNAFSYREDINEVMIMNDDTIIDDRAFAFCVNLSMINIPLHTVVIHKGVFSKCKSLTEIVIPPSVMAIDVGAFSGCENLKRIVFPNESNLSIINEWAFSNCGLEEIDLSNCRKLNDIRDYAFDDCNNLKRIILPINYSKNIENITNKKIIIEKK